MVPNTQDPEDRAFQIPDLRGWVNDNRRELVIAALTLINNWVSQGMEDGDLQMGSFSRWAAIISGIMEANGYDQFMGNIPQLKSRVDPVRETMREFVTAWYNEYGTTAVDATKLIKLASIEVDEETGQEVGKGILLELLDSNSRRGRANQLRNLLRKHLDRTFRVLTGEPEIDAAQYKITSNNKRVNGYMIYRLTAVSPQSEPRPDPPPGNGRKSEPQHGSSQVHLRFTERSTPEEASHHTGSGDLTKRPPTESRWV